MNNILGDFVLPKCLIADHPAQPRDHSRLLVVHREREKLEDSHFYNLPSFLRAGDLLVLNNTKVFSARVYLERDKTKGKHECLFLKKDTSRPRLWEVLIQKSNRLLNGETLTTCGKHSIHFIFRRLSEQSVRLEETCHLELEDFNNFGNIPIPPYLGRSVNESDQENYQSVFAKQYGSAASPTASLHFTDQLLTQIK